MISKEKFLEGVRGLSSQKEELYNFISWFDDIETYESKGLHVPTGIVLYGKPGCGKTFIIKKIVEELKYPTFVIGTETRNAIKEAESAFEKARNENKAIVVIDELDLLINNNSSIIRLLQDSIDGIHSKNNHILVLAATNNYHLLPNALLREGRLEKHIEIDGPADEEIPEILKEEAKGLPLSIDETLLESPILIDTLSDSSYTFLRTFLNDVILRCLKNGKVTMSDLLASSSSLQEREIVRSRKPRKETCYHEAGHAVMAYAYQQNFRIGGITINGEDGHFFNPQVDKTLSFADHIANIHIYYAGALSEKMFFHQANSGCEGDLEEARRTAYHLICRIGYRKLSDTLPEVSCHTRRESASLLQKRERRIYRLLSRCERETRRYLKKHKNQIVALATALEEKPCLTSLEVQSILKANDNRLKSMPVFVKERRYQKDLDGKYVLAKARVLSKDESKEKRQKL